MKLETAILIIEIDAKIELLYQLKKFNEVEVYKRIKSKIYNESKRVQAKTTRA